MKRIILPLLALTAIVSANGQVEQPDTLQNISNANSIVVTRTGDKTDIIVRGLKSDPDFYYSLSTDISDNTDGSNIAGQDEWLPSFPFLRERPRHRTQLVYGRDFYIGGAMPVSAPHGLSSSIEVGMGYIGGLEFTPWQKGPEFTIGLGFHYRQYTLHYGQIFRAHDHRLEIIDAGTDNVSSRLRNFGFQIPLSIYQPIYKDFGVTVGAAAVFNTFTRAASDYTIGDTHHHQSYRGLHQRLLTADIFASFGWKSNLGFYVRYSPSSIFTSQWGPEFKTISFGVTFGI